VDLKDRLAEIVGRDNIIDDPFLLESYAKDYSFVSGRAPSLVVYPQNKDQVQKIVRIANEIKMPIVPVSSGPPRFHGDTVPCKGGIIVDFSKMKRIIKIDPINRYVIIEPGVTYGELIPELRKHGLRLNIPLLPRASKSVVTSRLEREPVLIPKYQYDYLDPLLTLEVIFGTGDEFRTGSASGPGPLEILKADKVNPWGPGSIDFFRFLSGAQGTMGLVTWATIKVEVLPSLKNLYFIPVKSAREIVPPIDALLRKRVVDECLVLNNAFMAAILADNHVDYEKLRADLPPWVVLVCLAGYQRRPEERIAVMEKYLKEICTSIGVQAYTSLPGAEGRESRVLELLSNSWNKEPYWKLRFDGFCQDIFFLSPPSKVSKFVEIMNEVVTRFNYPKEEVRCYIQPMVQGRGYHCEFSLPYNIQQVEIVRRLFIVASEILIRDSAFFSRPYGLWAEMVYRQYPEGMRVLKKLKSIFDPNNILNPGKLCF